MILVLWLHRVGRQGGMGWCRIAEVEGSIQQVGQCCEPPGLRHGHQVSGTCGSQGDHRILSIHSMKGL